MKTTFGLPEDLMDVALQTGCAPTKTATVIYAFEQLIRTAKIAKLRSLRGMVPDSDLNLDTLRGRNRSVSTIASTIKYCDFPLMNNKLRSVWLSLPFR